MRNSGQTMIDAIVSLGLAALLLAVTIAVREQLGQAEAITQCQANLRQMSAALSRYGGDHRGAFPRTRYDPAAPLSAYTAPDTADPFAQQGPLVNDVTAAAFLLAREQDLTAGVFICPAALRNGLAQKDVYTSATLGQRANFRGRIYYNYSLANMYPDAAATSAGYTLENFAQLGPNFAIAADTNPGDETSNPNPKQSRIAARMANSPNHERDGQNVLYADGSARFVPTPYAATGDVSFYASAGVFPQPASASDSVLVPIWQAGPQLTPTAVKVRRWVFCGGGDHHRGADWGDSAHKHPTRATLAPPLGRALAGAVAIECEQARG